MRTTYQSSSSRQVTSQSQQRQAEQGSSRLGGDLAAEKDFFLKYASLGDEVVLSGSNDYGILAGLKDAILKLRSDYFNSSGSILIQGPGDLSPFGYLRSLSLSDYFLILLFILILISAFELFPSSQSLP